MKFIKTKKILLMLAVLTAMTFAFAINSLAADEYLTSLTVYENGSASAEKTVTVSNDMTVNVGKDCKYVTAKAVCSEGYKAVLENGLEKTDLSGERLNVNEYTDFQIVKQDDDKTVVATYRLTVNQIDTTVKDIKVNYTGADGNGVSDVPKVSGNKYSLNLDGTVKTVTLAVTPNSDRATVEYGRGIDADGTIKLNNGAEVDFFIKDNETGEYTKYTLTITQDASLIPNNNADLKAISASNGSWDKSFKAATTTYKLTVPYSTPGTTLSATAAETNAKVIINQSSATPAASDFNNAKNSASESTGTLTRGKTVTYYAHVLSSDGTANKTYTFSVYRSNSSTSDNAELKSLSVKYGSKSRDMMPSFDADAENYYVVLPNDEDEIRVYVTSKDSDATITVDGVKVKSGSYETVGLSNGSNKIRIKVTSSSGAGPKNYYLNAYLGSKKGSNCDADDIQVRTGTKSSLSSSDKTKLNKTFSAGTTTYNVEADSKDKYFSVRWDRGDTNSTAYLIYGDEVESLSDGSFTSGIKISSTSYFTVRVYSPSCEDYKDYKFYLKGSDSSDAYLSDLTVKANGAKVSLSPSFTKKTYNYIANVSQSTSYVTITPVVSESGSTVWVDGTKVKSGNSSASISITGTSKRIAVKVESEDGDTTLTYYVTVSKNGAVTNPNDGQITNPGVKKMTLVMRINSTAYLLNNTNKKLLAPPYMDIKHNRTLVPIRAIAESMGATVGYDNVKKLVTVKLEDKNLSLTLGKEIVVGNINYGAPGLKNGTTFVPIRYISEQLGGKVAWDNKNKIVTVTK